MYAPSSYLFVASLIYVCPLECAPLLVCTYLYALPIWVHPPTCVHLPIHTSVHMSILPYLCAPTYMHLLPSMCTSLYVPSWICSCTLQSVHAPLVFVCQFLKYEFAIMVVTWRLCGHHCGQSNFNFILSKVNMMLIHIRWTSPLLDGPSEVTDMSDRWMHKQPWFSILD